MEENNLELLQKYYIRFIELLSSRNMKYSLVEEAGVIEFNLISQEHIKLHNYIQFTPILPGFVYEASFIIDTNKLEYTEEEILQIANQVNQIGLNFTICVEKPEEKIYRVILRKAIHCNFSLSPDSCEQFYLSSIIDITQTLSNVSYLYLKVYPCTDLFESKVDYMRDQQFIGFIRNSIMYYQQLSNTRKERIVKQNIEEEEKQNTPLENIDDLALYEERARTLSKRDLEKQLDIQLGFFSADKEAAQAKLEIIHKYLYPNKH